MTELAFTVADVRKITGGRAPLAAEMVPYFNRMAPLFEVTTIDRMAELVGQVAVESLFQYRKEIWGPTKAQLGYEGRADLGNTRPGDGKKFMGHGGIQVTGRANTQEFYNWCLKKFPTLNVPNFMERPDLIGTGVWWMLAAFWYWQKHDLNKLADRRNTRGITRKVNGGYNHLKERMAAVDRARAILTARYGMGGPVIEHEPIAAEQQTRAAGDMALSEQIGGTVDFTGMLSSLGDLLPGTAPRPAPTGSTAGLTDVPRGTVSEPLRQIQKLLFAKGYKVVGAADGKWGPDTRDAALAFRRDNRLPAPFDLNGDGVLSASEVMDAEFMTALMAAEKRAPDPDRAAAPTLDIAKIVPEVAKARLSKVLSGVGIGGAGVPAIGGFIWSQIQSFPELRASLDPVFRALSFDIPTWGWLAILACVMAGTWWFSRGSERAAVNAYRAGERLAQD